VLRDWLGRGTNEDYIDYFAATKRAEYLEYHGGVSDWELRRYLTLF
jgi:glutamine synthetase